MDHVALITGGSRGVGRTIAHLFIAHGMRVAFNSRSESELDKAVAELRDSVSSGRSKLPSGHLLQRSWAAPDPMKSQG